MRLDIARDALVIGERTDSGIFCRLYRYDTGEFREFLLGSLLEAATYAAHFGADLTYDVPRPLSPLRAMSWDNVLDTMFAPVVSAPAASEDTSVPRLPLTGFLGWL